MAAETPPFWCCVCSKDLQSAKALREHELGSRHLRKAGAPAGTRRPAPLTESDLFDGIASGSFRRIVVCTGAGVSTAAGWKDFRSPGGLFDEIRSRFGSRFPEVLANPEALLSRSFVTRCPEAWRDEISPWLAAWKPAGEAAAPPTATHRFCRWLHERGVLARVYTQNVDGLHTSPELDAMEGEARPASGTRWHDKVVECHGSLRDGSVVLYGDGLPERVNRCLAEDFGPCEAGIDLVLVFGTALQVAPFCAIPNLAPRGCARVLVNRCLDDCMHNEWSRPPTRQRHALLDCYGGLGGGFKLACSMKLAGRAVSLSPQWADTRRWRQLLCEEACDEWVKRFFSSEACVARGLTLDDRHDGRLSAAPCTAPSGGAPKPAEQQHSEGADVMISQCLSACTIDDDEKE